MLIFRAIWSPIAWTLAFLIMALALLLSLPVMPFVRFERFQRYVPAPILSAVLCIL